MMKVNQHLFMFFNFTCLIVHVLSMSHTPLTPPPAVKIPKECLVNCKTPFNSEIGRNKGVIAFSNCNDQCSNNEDEGVIFPKTLTDFYEDVYVGIRWQCVEYSRRWLIIIKKVTFESIDSAFQIFDLKTVKDLTDSNRNHPFVSYHNGNANPPAVGDLIIYPKAKDAPHGHVAVVTGVNLSEGYVEIGEQNYTNDIWEDPYSYARRIVLEKRGDNYYLRKTLNQNNEEETEPIGWKRVMKN